MNLMNIKPIRTESDYQAALHEIENLMSAQFDTPEGELLDLLVTLVTAYEQKHFPLDFPDPVAAICFHMEQQGLVPKDLEPMIGRADRVNAILTRKRPLTLTMIWRLHHDLGIPAESLIKPNSSRI
jgi:HTH-type transcriptional regulator/antitoxin HigA